MNVNLVEDKMPEKIQAGDIIVYKGILNIDSFHYLIIEDSKSKYQALCLENNALMFKSSEYHIDSLIIRLNAYHSASTFKVIKEDDYQLSRIKNRKI